MTDTAARRQASPALRRFLEAERIRVDAALDAALPPADTPPATLHEAMRYSVFAGGKRLRPLLAMAAARACGGTAEAALPAACAVELIHTYSLIHDDLPAFDDEELRRGKPTSHAVFGETVAILAGDALQALAFEQLAAAPKAEPGRVREALRVLARAAGSVGMCGGQTMDVEAAGGRLDIHRLRTLHALKTGALLTASVLCGALLAGAADDDLAALRTYGDAVGLAFQIVDDLLDVEGTVEDLGKRPGGDADRAQPTFPTLIGVDAARHEARQLRDRAMAALEPFGEGGAILRELADYIVDRDR